MSALDARYYLGLWLSAWLRSQMDARAAHSAEAIAWADFEPGDWT